MCCLAGDFVLDQCLTIDTDLLRFLIDFDHQILIGDFEYRVEVLDLDRCLRAEDLEVDLRL